MTRRQRVSTTIDVYCFRFDIQRTTRDLEVAQVDVRFPPAVAGALSEEIDQIFARDALDNRLDGLTVDLHFDPIQGRSTLRSRRPSRNLYLGTGRPSRFPW